MLSKNSGLFHEHQRQNIWFLFVFAGYFVALFLNYKCSSLGNPLCLPSLTVRLILFQLFPSHLKFTQFTTSTNEYFHKNTIFFSWYYQKKLFYTERVTKTLKKNNLNNRLTFKAVSSITNDRDASRCQNRTLFSITELGEESHLWGVCMCVLLWHLFSLWIPILY